MQADHTYPKEAYTYLHEVIPQLKEFFIPLWQPPGEEATANASMHKGKQRCYKVQSGVSDLQQEHAEFIDTFSVLFSVCFKIS